MLVAEHSGPGSCRAQPWEEGEGWQAGNVDAVAAAVGEEGVAAGVVRWVLGARWDTAATVSLSALGQDVFQTYCRHPIVRRSKAGVRHGWRIGRVGPVYGLQGIVVRLWVLPVKLGGVDSIVLGGSRTPSRLLGPGDVLRSGVKTLGIIATLLISLPLPSSVGSVFSRDRACPRDSIVIFALFRASSA